jgi:uncharacterized protein YndB with AHSA1/START domain
METKPFVFERTFDAPASNVWKAITQAALMRQWFWDIPHFRPEIGFEFSFKSQSCEEGNIHLCRVIEVITGKKLSYSWRYEGYEGDSLVSFELFEEGKNKTRLRLTHAGLESFPRDLMAKKGIADGWTHLVGDSLQKLLENIPVQSIS